MKLNPHKDCDESPCWDCHRRFMRAIMPVIDATVEVYVKSKHQKRVEGEKRNEAWRTLTPQQQLADIKQRGGSKRQLAKLEAKVNTSKEG